MQYKQTLSVFIFAAALLSGKTMATEIRYSQDSAVADTLVVLTDSQLSGTSDLAERFPQLAILIEQEKFKGNTEQQLEILLPANENQPKRLVLVGSGDAQSLTIKTANQLGASLAVQLQKRTSEQLIIDTRALNTAHLNNAEIASQIAHGLALRSYSFGKYHTQGPASKAATVEFVVTDKTATEARHQQLDAVAQGVFLARDLTNEPANVLTPESFAKHAQELKKLGVKVEIMAEKELKKHGMGAILAVGQGSINPPRLVVIHWKGSNTAPVALVGKGITFDTGGYNLKTSAESIHRMTSDMAGGAAVLGAVKALALQKAPVNVIGVVALAENRISDRAFLPGDVITTAAGLTVEILSTDAEGRLVLADALWWVNKTHKPSAIIDLATLTGAKFTALGAYYAGAFGEHDALIEQLRIAGETIDEKVWRLPLSKEFAPELKSRVADLRNTGRSTGASSAAYFLQQFTGDTPWVHLDIAGNALSNSSRGVTPEGATGFGVRLLTEWLAQNPQ